MLALQGRKSLRAGLAVEDSVVRSGSRGCGVLGSFSQCAFASIFADRWASFLVTNSLVQNHPDQPTQSMGNRPDGLIVSQARHIPAIDNLEDASFVLTAALAD